MTSREEELLNRAQAGDKEAVNELLSLRKGLVVAIARKYYLLGGDQEDIIQEGMIGLYKAITCFDKQKSDNFVSFATTIIDREIVSAIREANAGKHQVLGESLLVDDDEALASEEMTPERNILSSETITEISKEIGDKLSKFERVVVEYFLKGYSYTDIAKILNKSSKSIDNALTRIKKKLENLKGRL